MLNRTIQVGDDREGYGGAAFALLNTDPATGAVTGRTRCSGFPAPIS
ncbi:MAG: hypothetical protein R3F11_30115 [Verrucomicrobiales bacterium]